MFENLRIDPAHEIGPLRVNAWVSLVVCFVLGVGWFVWLGRHAPPQRRPGDATPTASVEPSTRDAVVLSAVPVAFPQEERP